MTRLKSTGTITVLQLIAPTHFGGAEQVVLNLIECLDKSRFRVVVGPFVNVHFKENEFVERLQEANIFHKVLWLRRTVDIENVFKIVRFIQKEGIDIIHSHGYRSDIIGLITANITRLPIVSTIHGWIPIDSRLKFYERCDRFALRFFDRLLPVSDQIRNVLAASGINPGKINCIHNAVSINSGQEQRQVLPAAWKESCDFLIGVIGRLSPEKDVSGFVQAAGLLAGKFNRVKFLVVGDGPERKTLEEMAVSQGLKERINFTGFVNDMDGIYRSLDLLVISSTTEGIPLVVLEAMKHGIPVVSTRVGGIPEVIEDGVDGMLVESRDPQALSEAIEILLLDNNRYHEISRKARNKIVTHFNQSIWIEKIEKIYSNLLR